MKGLALLAALAAVLSPAAGGASAPPSLFGIVGGKVLYQQLVRFDPATLRPLAGGVPLAGHRAGWSFSPDGNQLVLGRSRERCGTTSLRFVDVGAMRSLGDVTIAVSGPVAASAWLDGSHVAAVVGPAPCAGAQQTRVVVVDAAKRRVQTRTWLRGTTLDAVSAPGKLVLLLAPSGKIGSATMAVVDAGGVRHKTLGGIPAGQKLPSGTYVSEVSRPALAVDPSGGHAFVVPGVSGLDEIDLRTLRVGYHVLTERSPAKGVNGSVRHALWLGHGLLAITGTESVFRTTGGHTDVSTTAAGLRIVDTRDWTYRSLDPQISTIERAGGLLFATGSSYSYDGTHATETSPGLVVYTLAGRERYRLFEGESVAAAAIGGRGYATLATARGESRTVSFDLATGTLGASVATPVWRLLLGRAASA